jgi:hypothetical protein
MTTQEESDSKWDKIKGNMPIICKLIYFILPIILLTCFLFLIYYKLPQIYSQLCTKQTGYLVSSTLIIYGLLGLWLDNTSLFQRQAFKLLIWVGIFMLILTFCFSITIDILDKIKDKNSIPTKIMNQSLLLPFESNR